MNNENKGIVCVAILVVWIIGCLIYAVFIKSDNNIPLGEQKPRMQDVKTEVLTHVIRCTAYVNDACAEYKVYSVIKE